MISLLRYSSIHALIIGIDCYEADCIQDLQYAVSDAGAVAHYLRHDLLVPESQITVLYDRQATQAAIIQNIRRFRTLTTLHKGDPILLYFVGHGTDIEGGTAIVPYDSFSLSPENTPGSRTISHDTLNALLSEVAGVGKSVGKGDNIVSEVPDLA